MKKIIALLKSALKKLTGSEVKTPPPTVEIPALPQPTLPTTNSVDKVSLKWGEFQLPVRGRFVIESHYATKSESFGSGYDPKKFPDNAEDGIERHMNISAALFARTYPDLYKKLFKDDLIQYKKAVFNQPFERVWTPANDGGTNFFGQGARGNVKPTPEEEMWQANMMFKKLVPPGTKFLLRNPKNGKECVVQMGYEIGPGTQSYMGGAVPEVHWWLESGNTTELELHPVDQAMPLGPVLTESPAQPPVDPKEKKKLPTRAEVDSFVRGIIEGTVANPQTSYPYDGIRETDGKNRSLAIDGIIRRQGGAMGEPYCLYGIQDILDAIRKKFDVIIDLPEGGSTQSFWNDSNKTYKTQLPSPLCIGIYRKGDTWQGHAVLAMGNATTAGVYDTFEFNTSLSATMLERDGEGCGFRTRNVNGYIGYSLRGFVDIYAAMKVKG